MANKAGQIYRNRYVQLMTSIKTMRKTLSFLSLPITLLGLTCTTLLAKAEHIEGSTTAAKGAKIYCFMRNTGNDHEVSWKASYAVIKRQRNSLFKTSPKHAAVMIIESVVQHPDKYENCGNYLGDLFGSEPIITETETETEVEINEIKEDPTNKSTIKDRYKY